MRKIFTSALLLSTILVISCSKTKTLASRLEGTWNIDTRETINGAQQKSDPNIGTFEFKSDGTGILTIKTVYNNYTNTSVNTFYWSNTASTLTLIMGNSIKYFQVLTNESKKQVWEESFTNTNSSSSGGTPTTTTNSEKYTLSKK